MRKAVFAGAVALAMMGPLFVSEKGIGPVSASAQEVIVTEGKIALTDEAGGRREFSAGEGYLLPKGFAGRWETLVDAKKIAVTLED